MSNRPIPKQPAEKIKLRGISDSPSSQLSILPSIYKPSNRIQYNGKGKHSDDTDLTISKTHYAVKPRMSVSITNLFSSSQQQSSKVPGIYIPSLRLSIESIVLGQKLQMNAELLLLSSSSELWPISLHHLNKVERDFSKFSDCYEEMVNLTKVFNWEIKEVEEKLIYCIDADISIKTKVDCLTDLVNTSITLMELIYQTVYSISSTQPTWKKPPVAILDRKTIISAIDEVELCCVRIREVLLRTSYLDDDNIPNAELESMMLFSCGQFSSALTYLAMCCRTAAANVEIAHKSSPIHSNPTSATSKEKFKLFPSSTEPFSAKFQEAMGSASGKHKENLFQLAMQSVSKSSQCLLSSVKTFVEDRNPENRFITESFTNSVSSAVKSFAAMATSSKFIKSPASLPISIKTTRTTLFGACMNLISPTIELLLTIPNLFTPNKTKVSPGNDSSVLNDSVINKSNIAGRTSDSNNDINNTIVNNPLRSIAYSSNTNLTTVHDTCQRVIHCIKSMKEALTQLQKTLSLYQHY